MKRLIVVLLICVFMLTGCAMLQRTVYVYPELPDFDVNVPEKPTLLKVNGDVPKEVNENTIKLITYSNELELIIESYEVYLDSIKTNWSDKDAEN